MTHAEQGEQRVVPVHQSPSRHEVVPSERVQSVEGDPSDLPNGLAAFRSCSTRSFTFATSGPGRRADPRVSRSRSPGVGGSSGASTSVARPLDRPQQVAPAVSGAREGLRPRSRCSCRSARASLDFMFHLERFPGNRLRVDGSAHAVQSPEGRHGHRPRRIRVPRRSGPSSGLRATTARWSPPSQSRLSHTGTGARRSSHRPPSTPDGAARTPRRGG